MLKCCHNTVTSFTSYTAVMIIPSKHEKFHQKHVNANICNLAHTLVSRPHKKFYT